ncbi:predicted protein [Nematostella vectensis]|uniref:MACPF domain-containing protein n=1 Tax=Nematostella vectensis TaxID=45351 RepID=A7S0A0_NEMVE|nr:predicted protein [Nematostella vectensis]|eukprot:XP_001634860.1 predicted protein [Nematostella vectensis]
MDDKHKRSNYLERGFAKLSELLEGKTPQIEDKCENDGKAYNATKLRVNLDQTESASKAENRDTINTGQKRAVPAVLASLAANKDVQAAVVEKGIEVAGKIIDKQLQTWDEQGKKAEDFLKKKIKLDIMPDKGWESTDMFVPAGYHINTEVEDDGADKELETEKVSPTPYTYPSGLGSVVMNGCWGTGYTENDPCYNAMEKTTQCRNMIDGAAFIGVGFDLRGEYSPESRKMSIIQRNCGGHSMYEDFQVPDTMNVHGIYDTSASMLTFESRTEYQHYLEKEAGVSGSYFGFYGGVKKAWGSSESTSSNSLLSIFDVDVDRYEIFKDEVKPQDLSRAFLREFMSLPPSYFDTKAPIAYQDFVLRWGTHYIKSARFGGQLELRKTVQRTSSQTKEQVSEMLEAEYRSLFWSAGAKYSTSEGTTNRQENKFTSSSIVVQGGSQEIASILSDEYAPTFKNEFKAWLQSINDYPKAFKFHLSPITDLVDFRGNDLFPDEEVTWGCEAKASELQTDPKNNRKYFTYDGEGGVEKRQYCDMTSRAEVDAQLRQRRESLKRAIEVYMEEGPISISEVSIQAGKRGCQTSRQESTQTPPTWIAFTTSSSRVVVSFDMREDLVAKPETKAVNISKDMIRLLKFSDNKWYTSEDDGVFHAYDGYDNSDSAILSNKKVSIFGLILTYDESKGTLTLANRDVDEAQEYFAVPEKLKGTVVAKVCHGNAIPKNPKTWYYVEISPYGVGIYKAQKLRVVSLNNNAVGLGDKKLYQSYFVCLKESEESTLVEYGKTKSSSRTGDVFLTMIDTKEDDNEPLKVRFYAFGNDDNDLQITNANIQDRALTQTNCMGSTKHDSSIPYCIQDCHPFCDPLAGCKEKRGGQPAANECNRYRVKLESGDYSRECPAGSHPDKNRVCRASYELQYKRGRRPSETEIADVNLLSDFTMCLWVRIRPALGPTSYELVLYGENNIVMRARIVNSKVRWEAFAFSEWSLGPEFPRDDQWRLFCLIGDSSRQQMSVLIDNQRSNFGTFPPSQEIIEKGPRKLRLLRPYPDFPGAISDLNVWDRVLSPEELHAVQSSCGGLAGNLVNWYEIERKLEQRRNDFEITKPSTCKPQSAPEGTTRDYPVIAKYQPWTQSRHRGHPQTRNSEKTRYNSSAKPHDRGDNQSPSQDKSERQVLVKLK